MMTAIKASSSSRNLPCVNQVRLAGFVDQVGNFQHRPVHRQILQAHVNGHSKQQSENTKQNSEQEQSVAIDAEEADLGQIGKFQVGLSAGGLRADWASAAVALNNVRAALTAPIFTNRLRSEPSPASQVRISDPPSRILIQDNYLSTHRLPAHLLALEVLLQGARVWLTGISYRPPLQDWIGALRLTAANELCPGVTAGKDTHDPHTG